MFTAVKRFLVALAVLGGMLIALHFILKQLARRAPAPVSSIAGRINSLVNGD